MESLKRRVRVSLGKGLIRLGFRLLGAPVPDVEVEMGHAEEDGPAPPPRVTPEARGMLLDEDGAVLPEVVSLRGSLVDRIRAQRGG